MLPRNLLFSSLLITNLVSAQGPYAPAAGMPGSTAIHKDSTAFVDWAFGCSVDRGYLDITNKPLGYANAGTDFNATDQADGLSVSLGDSGVAIVSFLFPIVNGSGYDFAVFENSFSNNFLELAKVSVSSNGIDFFEFPAHSLTPDTGNIGSFGLTDPTNINNLAGKYRAQYGTPFDLAELAGIPGLNINNVTEIMLVDVTGTVDSTFSLTDTAGNKIIDPFPTAFDSGGFDLDAVGVIHSTISNTINEHSNEITFYPNPVHGNFRVVGHRGADFGIYDLSGKLLFDGKIESGQPINVDHLNQGLYILKINNNSLSRSTSFVKI